MVNFEMRHRPTDLASPAGATQDCLVQLYILPAIQPDWAGLWETAHADQQNAQQKLGINRRTAPLAVAILQLFAHKSEADVLFDEPQQMILRNLIFQAK